MYLYACACMNMLLVVEVSTKNSALLEVQGVNFREKGV
jgi:hypothetical protein